jgi:type VI secretion system secreted protein Hcp
MGFDAFIKFDDIEGESTDSKHAGWIEIINFDLDIGQRVSRTASSAGGGTTERADFSEFNFSKLLDRATPKLTLACAAGTHFNRIVIEICRAGNNKVKFMEYILTNCIIRYGHDVRSGHRHGNRPAPHCRQGRFGTILIQGAGRFAHAFLIHN